MDGTDSTKSHPPGVQSLHRALDLLEIIAAAGGHLSMGEIAATAGLPQPTIHRLLKTLITRGYIRQLPSRRYALGHELAALGSAANQMLGAGAEHILAQLVAELGESANLAMRSGDRAEYIAHVPSRHSMRMFTEVGTRVEMHCTGVGKALLAELDDRTVSDIVQRVGFTQRTANTISNDRELAEELGRIRRQGYALDEEEQELGVRCIAMAVPTRSPLLLAVSISGPLSRMDDQLIKRAASALRTSAAQLAEHFTSRRNP